MSKVGNKAYLTFSGCNSVTSNGDTGQTWAAAWFVPTIGLVFMSYSVMPTILLITTLIDNMQSWSKLNC